jgi:hypothetical protein
MNKDPFKYKDGLQPISLDVAEQADYREALIAALVDRESFFVMFHLRLEEGGSVSVHVAEGAAQGLRAGTVGNRNLDRLKAAMDGKSTKMVGLIEWTSSTPKVKFIPAYSLR